MIDNRQIEENNRALLIAIRNRKDELGLTFRELSDKLDGDYKSLTYMLSPYSVRKARGLRTDTLWRLLTALDLTFTISKKEDTDAPKAQFDIHDHVAY